VAENSKIEWCDHTFNPWIGCTKISPACDNCYAAEWDKRYEGGQHWGPKAPRRRTSESNWRKPLGWNKKAEKLGIRYRVFCASLADVFDNKVPMAWRTDLWALIHMTPHLDWLLLTKRPQNIKKMMGAWDGFPDNVWLGTTVENQEVVDKNIPILLDVPARIHFLSCEPLLEEINLYPHMPNLDWVIAGGESGQEARPMHPEWVRKIRNDCHAHGVPFLFKQWGQWHADALMYTCAKTGECPPRNMKIGKKKAGRKLDGRTWDEFPQPDEEAP